jgi:hypothetical protein
VTFGKGAPISSYSWGQMDGGYGNKNTNPGLPDPEQV